MANNLKLDGATHDIIIGRGATRVEGLEYTAQLVKCRLLAVLNEWYADPNIGLPWFTDIMIKAPDLGLIEGLILTSIRGTPHVQVVTSIDLNLDHGTRTLSATFEALSDWGIINSSVSLGGN